MKVKKTDLPVMAPESEILPAGLDDSVMSDMSDDLQDEEDDDTDIDDDEVSRTGCLCN